MLDSSLAKAKFQLSALVYGFLQCRCNGSPIVRGFHSVTENVLNHGLRQVRRARQLTIGPAYGLRGHPHSHMAYSLSWLERTPDKREVGV